MNARTSMRVSANQVGLALVALIVIWAAISFGPFRPQTPPAPAPEPVQRPGEAELAAAGLRYNVDWVGLPQYFAVWANTVRWTDNKVQFAYWSAGTESYSYFFEATRTAGGFQFRRITLEEMTATGLFSYKEDGSETVHDGISPHRTDSETHPFVFWTEEAATARATGSSWQPEPSLGPVTPPRPSATVDLSVKNLEVPKPGLRDSVP